MNHNTVYLSSCKAYEYEALRAIIDEQFEALGFAEKIKPGMKVAVKPNLVVRAKEESGTCTHPLVTAAVCTWLSDHGAQVTVVESPGGPYTPAMLRGIYQHCGYTEMAQQYGVTLNEDCSYEQVSCPQGEQCRLFDIVTPILQADLVVDIAKLKSHCMMMFSGCSKNLFGVVPGLMKPELHCRFPEKEAFAAMLVDLCERVKPGICVMDGIIAMEGNGPTGGNPKAMHVLAASENPYAIDTVCCELAGMKQEEVPLLQEAVRRGLCPEGLSNIPVLGDSFASLKVDDFRMPESKSSDFLDTLPHFLQPLAKKITTPYPKIQTKKCVGCGKCAESCPQHTIRLHDGKAQIQYKNCIHCFCCHEMCPQHVIDIRRFSLFRF